MKEKRTFKKVLSMFLSFVMVVSLITVTDFTDGKNGTEDVHAATVPTDHTTMGGNPLPYEATEIIKNGDFTNKTSSDEYFQTANNCTFNEKMAHINVSGTDDYLATKTFTCKADATYRISYYIYITDATSLKYNMFIGHTDPTTDYWTNNAMPTYITGNTNGWQKVEFTWKCQTTAPYYMGFRNFEDKGSAQIYIDDIVMYEVNPDYLKLEWKSIDENGNWVFNATGFKTRSKYYNFTKAIVDGTEYSDIAWLGFAYDDLNTYGIAYIYTNGFAGEGKDPVSSLYIPKGTKITGVSDTPWNIDNKTNIDFILENDIYVKKIDGIWQQAEYVAPPSDHTPELGEDGGLPDGKVNMITNGDCTSGLVNVNFKGDTEQTNGMVKISVTGTDDYLQFYGLPCEKDHTYVISYWIKITDASNLNYSNFVTGCETWAEPCGTAPTFKGNTNGWEKVEFEYTANKANSAETPNLMLGFRSNSSNGSATIYIDDIVMYDATKIKTSADLTYYSFDIERGQIQFTIPNDKIQTLKAKEGEAGCWATTRTKVTMNGELVDVDVVIYPYSEYKDNGEKVEERYLCLQGNSIKEAIKSGNIKFEGSIDAPYDEEIITLNFTKNVNLEKLGTVWSKYSNEHNYSNGNITYYNIDNGTSYVITSSNNAVEVKKNGTVIEAVAGTTLTDVGTYDITSIENDEKFVKKVVLYKNGDANASGNVDICDLVSMKRESENKGCNLAYAADLNRSDKVDSVDLNAMRRALAVGNANTAFVQPKGNSILNGVMPIGGMTGPSYYSGDANKFVNSDIWDEFKKMGINNIGYDANDFSDPDKKSVAHQNMKLAEDRGIGIYVTDGNCIGGKTFHIAEKENMLKYIGNYSSYKSFLGMSIVDEPHTDSYQKTGSKKLSDYAPAMSMFNNYANIHGYVSMYPWVENANAESYSKYMQEVNDAGAEILSYDNYPFKLTENKNWIGTVTGYKKDDSPQYNYFYNNLVVARQKSLDSGKPFHTYAQVGMFRDAQYKKNLMEEKDKYVTTPAEIQWQVSASLAFGSKGIQYYPLVQTDVYAKGEGNSDNDGLSGLITASGKVNTNYSGAVTETNRFVAAVDEVLMNCTNKGVIAKDSNASAYVTSLTSYNELTGVTGNNALVGCFDYYGKTALLVVNCNLENAQDITLNFNENCTGKVTQFDTTTSDVSGNSLKLNVAAGQCSLVVLD